MKNFSAIALLTVMSSQVQAFDWGSTDVQYLKGSGYINPFVAETSKFRKFDQDIITVEHADGWKYGDNFLFVDKIFYNGKEDSGVGSEKGAGRFHDVSQKGLQLTWTPGEAFQAGPDGRAESDVGRE